MRVAQHDMQRDHEGREAVIRYGMDERQLCGKADCANPKTRL